MKERLDGFLKKTNAKRLWPSFLIFAAGIALMLLGGGGLTNRGGKSGGEVGTELIDFVPSDSDTSATEDFSALYLGYEAELEKKLSEALSKVQGAGKVRVVLSLSSRGQIELAEDVTYEAARKADSGGDAEGSLTERKEIKNVLVTGKDGSTEPVIVKRLEPEAEGVLIVAEGGDDAEIKSALTKAAGALLNLPAHKIEVLKMIRYN